MLLEMEATTVTAPILREFAQRLVDFEATEGHPPTDRVSAFLSVSEKLRRVLSAIAGVAGFQSLIARALTLAKAEAEVPWLKAARLDEEGVLALDVDPQLDSEGAAQGGVVVIAHLLGLLVDFIGKDLTLSLVHEVWSQAGEFSKEEKKP